MSIFGIFQLSAHKQNQQQKQSESLFPYWTIDALCVVVLVLYFLYFALPAVGGHLADDEIPELYRYWYHGWVKWVWANICFWRQTIMFFRPGGVFYYVPLYHCFGLNPRPYHIAQITILAVTIPMIYYLARSLSSSRSVAFLAVLALCYHAKLISLVFRGSFSYDVLCGFFYFAALTYYIHFRERDVQLRPLQLVAFLALYVCALDFKEMAVTLPVIVLIYEVLKSPRWADWKQFIRWAYSSTIPALIAGLITAVYIYGRIHGPTSLAMAGPYRPQYSWSNFLKSNAYFVSQLFYGVAISEKGLLALWALVFIYAFLRRDRMLRLMAFWIVIVPLPLAFIVPIRGGGHLYLMLFGWAMIFANVASDLIELLCKFSLLIRQGARVGAATGAITRSTPTGGVRGTATGAAAAAAASNMSQTTLRIAATLVVALSLAIFTRWKNQPSYVRAFQNVGQKTSHVAQAFRSLDLRPAPGSTILVKGNPFIPGQGWNALFIPSLLWNDHSLQIWLDGVNKLTPQQLEKVDYIILLSEFHAEIVRAPESQRR
jgi:hypothetical protein